MHFHRTYVHNRKILLVSIFRESWKNFDKSCSEKRGRGKSTRMQHRTYIVRYYPG